MSQMNLKNLLPEDERRLLLHLGSRYRLINVGGKRPIAEVVEDLAGSDGFVGVPSGISHIANSVGVPNVVILTDKILEYHRGFDNYKNMVYWNKPNMVFYAGVGALMGDHEFIRDFPLRKRELIT
jgi:ADP-heptose:LPS heptosyltransferase